jgi:hypothetical protein
MRFVLAVQMKVFVDFSKVSAANCYTRLYAVNFDLRILYQDVDSETDKKLFL